jgi:hypothetical protein
MMEVLMRKLIMLPLSAALALAACGGDAEKGGENAAATGTAAGASGAAAGGGASANAASSSGGNMVQLRPGNYSVQIAVERFEIPGMPADQAQMMRSIMAGVSQQVQNQCVAEGASSQASMEDMYKRMGQGNCTVERMTMAGGRIDGALSCDAGGGRSTQMNILGEMTPESSTTTMSMVSNDPGLPQGRVEMDMRITMTRTGDCTADAAAR